MKPFSWNKEGVGWFLDASKQTGFHARLAQCLVPYLEPDDTLCDLGCGLGQLDLELAPYISKLTAVDTDARVIEMLRREAASRGMRNLDARCEDAATMGGSFDVVLMSFFGRSGAEADRFEKLCRRKVIRIVNAANRGNLYPGGYRSIQKDTIPIVKSELEARGRAYTLAVETIEFGQPLRSRQAARQFVRSHAPNAEMREIDAFLETHAVETGRADFPFYLPNRKQIGVFVIDAPG